MILITGATGNYGSKTIDHLLKKGVNPSNIAALVRNPAKAETLQKKGIAIRVGDYNHYDSLLKAFEAVDKLLFVSGSDIATRDVQHQNVVKAAKISQVKHILYTSFARNEQIASSAIPFIQNTHVTTENSIKQTGIPYTFLQHATYLDVLPMFLGEKAQLDQFGAIMAPAQSGKANYVLSDELAEVAAHIITTDGHTNKAYPLTNPEATSYQDIAEILSDAFGKQIQYNSPSVEEYQNTLKNAQVPEEYIGFLTAFSLAKAQGELEYMDADDNLSTFLGRKPTSTKDFLKQMYLN